MLRPVVQDKDGDVYSIKLPRYHIPQAEVCLLSAQVLHALTCGKSVQITLDIRICLAKEWNLFPIVAPVVVFHSSTLLAIFFDIISGCCFRVY